MKRRYRNQPPPDDAESIVGGGFEFKPEHDLVNAGKPLPPPLELVPTGPAPTVYEFKAEHDQVAHPRALREKWAFELIPAALHAVPELRQAIAIAVSCDEPVELLVNHAINQYVLAPLRDCVRSLVHTRGSVRGVGGDPAARQDAVDEIWDEAVIELWSGTVPPYDPVGWPLLWQYLAFAADRAFQRVKASNTRRSPVNLSSPDRSRPLIPRSGFPAGLLFGLLDSRDADVHGTSETIDRAKDFLGVVDRCALAPIERTILEMCYAQGQTLTEIAAYLGVSKDAVFKTHQRLIARLRGAFSSPDPGATPS